MLSLTLLLLTAPQAAAPAPLAEPPVVPSSRRLVDIRERLAASDEVRRRCGGAEVQRAAGAVSVMNNLMYRETDDVRGWLLLERRVAGCSTPISWPHSRGAVAPTPAPRQAD